MCKCKKRYVWAMVIKRQIGVEGETIAYRPTCTRCGASGEDRTEIPKTAKQAKQNIGG